MSGAARFKGSVQLGPLISFPIIAKAAVREEKFSFNRHCAEHGCRTQMGKPVCIDGGEELEDEQIVRGYGGVAGIDEEYLASLSAVKSPILALDGFVPAEDVEVRFYQKSYDVVPDKGGEKAYRLMLALMEESGKVALGRVVMLDKEYLTVLRPRDGVIAMELLYWPSELLSNAEAKAAVVSTAVSEQELTLGRQLVTMMSKPFEPEMLTNEYAARVGEYLAAFVEGQTPAEAPAPRLSHKSVMSLADSLTAALAAAGVGQEAEAPAKKAKKAKVA